MVTADQKGIRVCNVWYSTSILLDYTIIWFTGTEPIWQMCIPRFGFIFKKFAFYNFFQKSSSFCNLTIYINPLHKSQFSYLIFHRTVYSKCKSDLIYCWNLNVTMYTNNNKETLSNQTIQFQLKTRSFLVLTQLQTRLCVIWKRTTVFFLFSYLFVKKNDWEIENEV